MPGFAQFVMRHTEIGGAANQVPARVQPLQARSRVPTLAGQARQSLTEGCIQAFNKGGSEYASSARELEPLFCLLEQTVSHLARHLHDPLFLRALDHGPNVQVRPHF